MKFFKLPETIFGKIRRVELRQREDAADSWLVQEWRDDQFSELDH